MIYEYPEEFVVPVIYVEDLKEKYMNRNFGFKYLQLNKLISPDENSKEDIMFQIDKYQDQNISNKDIGFLNLDEDLLKDTYYEEDMFNYNSNENIIEYDDSKSIFDKIDNDYADSETLMI